MIAERYEIQEGGLVRLKSGSPDLKVIGLKDDSCEVEWGDEGQIQFSVFPLACLTTQAAQ